MPPVQENELKTALQNAYVNQIIAIRDRRRYYEERMLRSRRTWMALHEPRYHPTESNVGNYRIPAARRIIERTVNRAVKLLTPTVKWFEVAPMAGSNVPQEKLSNIDSFMWYVMRKKIKSRSNISQLVRCMVLYGFCVLKTSIMVQRGQVWPTQRAVDPFSFYIFPETSPTIEEAEDIFEDYMFSFERYQTFVQKGVLDAVKRSDITDPVWPYHIIERLAYQGITDPTANVDQRIENTREQLKKTTNGYCALTEKWVRREGNLYQVYILWNHVNGPKIVGFFKSAYDDPLYRMAIHRSLPSETYTNAQAEDIDELNNVQADMFNQFIDATDKEQGFIAVGDASGGRRDTWKFKGGAVWDIGPNNPREVLNFISPPNTSNNLLRTWQITNAMMNSLGGAGTIAEGQPGRNMPRSGEAVSSLINLGMTDIQDISEIIEQEVLTPGLSDIYKVSEMIPDDQLIKIPGGIALYAGGTIQSNVVRKEDIVGDYEFEWVGSLQFQDEAQRAQRLMIMLQMFLQPTTQQMLAQQGYTINLPDLIQMIWRSGIGERGLSKVVVTLQEMQQIMMKQSAEFGMPMQGMQPMQPGMPGTQQPMQPPQQNGQSPQVNLPPEVQQLLNQVKDSQSQNSADMPRNGGNTVPNLAPPIPKPTNGFVRR